MLLTARRAETIPERVGATDRVPIHEALPYLIGNSLIIHDIRAWLRVVLHRLEKLAHQR